MPLERMRRRYEGGKLPPGLMHLDFRVPRADGSAWMPAMPPRVKTVASITIGKFFDSHAEALGLKLLGGPVGFDRLIGEPAMNRPGLALAGFFSYFAKKRVQVLGYSELAYLKKLPDAMRVDPRHGGADQKSGRIRICQ